MRLVFLLTVVVGCLWLLGDAGAESLAPSVRVDKALRIASVTYRVPYAELRAVAWCESQFDPRARNQSSGASGIFQFLRGTWLSTPYRRFSVFDPEANALAAAWLVRQDGGWDEWTCSP